MLLILCLLYWNYVVGRKLLEERACTEERTAEAERKLSDLTSRINSMMNTDATETLVPCSSEQTLNIVSKFALIYA